MSSILLKPRCAKTPCHCGPYDDMIKWKHFPRYWPFMRRIHWSPVISPHKGQWRWAFMFSLNCAWINDLLNNREAGDLRRYRTHYDVIVMMMTSPNLWYETTNAFISFIADEVGTFRWCIPKEMHWSSSAHPMLWSLMVHAYAIL